MPTYEYECGKCGNFDRFQSMAEKPLAKCPDCGGGVRRLISGGAGLIVKGSGASAPPPSRGCGRCDDTPSCPNR